MDSIPLESTEEVKDLRVTIHRSLKPSSQCVKAAKKANMILGMIKRSLTYKSEDIIVQLYKHLVRPHLEYAIQAWSPWLVSDINILEKVQRRATKLVPRLYHVDYEERLKVLNLTSLKKRRERGDMIQLYKILHGVDLCNLSLNLKMHSATRGHSLKLAKPSVKKDVRKHSFTVSD
ncbi:uncharacterized protein [Ptychodera flava]|uniref:uncharacterized protein n=1 Tax=Ptychodera flava TaxID=63121 RepID=UPI00396A784C